MGLRWDGAINQLVPGEPLLQHQRNYHWFTSYRCFNFLTMVLKQVMEYQSWPACVETDDILWPKMASQGTPFSHDWYGETTYCNWLVVWNMFYFPYIGNTHPNWLSYFSEGWLNHQPDKKNGSQKKMSGIKTSMVGNQNYIQMGRSRTWASHGRSALQL